MTRPLHNERDHWPCGDYPDGKCPKRQPGCQDRCPEMLAAQLIAAENRKELRADLDRMHAADGVKVHSLERYNRRKAGQR